MSAKSPRGPTVRIVAVNDVYSLDNLPRLRSLTRYYRDNAPADLYLITLAGDFVGPSMLSSLDKGRGMVDALNTIGVTHVIFGNHEDDIDVEELRERIREFHGVWLNTNVPHFQPALPARQLLDVTAAGGRSVRIGLLGVVMEDETVYRRKPFGGATIEPANATALRESERLLREDGCTCVIPLTHQDIGADRQLAAQAQAQALPWPLILGGHEHAAFIEEIGKTWLVKAGADATHAAVIDLVWPAKKPPSGPDLPAVRVKLEAVADYPEDAALRARIEARMVAVHELETATLLRLPPHQSLSSVGTRAQPSTLATMLCTRIRDALGSDGCILNGGGIRGSRIYSDRFTYGDLKAELPFENEVTVVHLPGHVLAEAIHSSRQHAPAESGGYLHADDGMLIDEPSHVLRAVGQAPLRPDHVYRIAIMRNLMLGMDRIEPLVAYAARVPECLPAEGSGRGIKLVLIDAFCKELWQQLGPFEAVDTNQDGKLSESEIADAVARVTAAPASRLTVDFLVRAVDEDQDREISRDEIAKIFTEPKAK
jgi:2',3'-cyclic-nucleotide 2'-phosphodiesterase (5'-nucleotidase family)